MKLSWSHKLFLKINNQVGKRPALDNFMRFCAKHLIYFLSLAVLLWIFFQSPEILRHIIIAIMTLVITYLFSQLVGLLVKKPRPTVELPQIKQIIQVLTLRKSFPSDHTMISFLLVFLIIIFGAPIFFWIVLLLVACLVAIGRIYVGVHYPRDILGGIVLAVLSATVVYIII